MKVLLVHQNFPGQFLHLAPALAARGHDVRALTDARNTRPASVPVTRYRFDPAPVDPAPTRLGRHYTTLSDRGVAAARAARALRAQGYVPDVVLGHPGWGETLFLAEVWPAARHLAYAEFYYRGTGQDVNFDPEFADRDPFDAAMIAQGRAAPMAQAILHADAAVAPTAWQASTYPPALRDRIAVIHDGIDTDALHPDPAARLVLPDGTALAAGDEVLTYVARNLEPYRGIHILLRALPAVLAARPQARAVIVGGDGTSYGRAPDGGRTWRDILLAEVGDRLDLSRVHFAGRLPYADFRRLMQVSRVHAYLTYPFVLSWSLLEAMACGVALVASRTAPVEEVVQDGVNGRLVGFFDVPGWSAALTAALADPVAADPLRRAARATVADRFALRDCLPRMIGWVERGGR